MPLEYHPVIARIGYVQDILRCDACALRVGNKEPWEVIEEFCVIFIDSFFNLDRRAAPGAEALVAPHHVEHLVSCPVRAGLRRAATNNGIDNLPLCRVGAFQISLVSDGELA